MTSADSTRQQFEKVFRRPSSTLVRSPGRINLIGEHIDYLDGWVMPVAIDRHLYAAAAAIDGPVVRVWSESRKDVVAEISLDALSKREAEDERWLNYVIGVLAGYREAGVELPGFEVALTSNLPSGAGLSSSAALETVTALIVEALTGVTQGAVDRALICQKAEHDFAGVPCGIMDQLAVGACREEHSLTIDCRNLALRHTRLPDGLALIVANTGVQHALGDGEYRERREQCERALAILGVQSFRDCKNEDLVTAHDKLGDRLFRRARHAVTEMARVRNFGAALEAGSEDALGQLMLSGHESLRDDFEVSCRELDALVEAAYKFGIPRGLVGSRMTGGGFGGSTVSLVKRKACDDFIEHLQTAYAAEFDRDLNAFETSAVGGAEIIS